MNVLLAIDGSAESIAAAEHLACLPWSTQPSVHVLTVLEAFDSVETSVILPGVEERTAGEHFGRVREVLETVGYHATHVIKQGHPSRAILDAAQETDADLIVLGAIGHSAVFRIVLGSTADYVANHAACSVLVVRPDTVRTADSMQFRVLLAYDGSAYAETASRQMFSLSWSAQRDRIHVAMMLGGPQSVPGNGQGDPEGTEEAKKTLRRLPGADATSYELSYTVRESSHIGSALLEIATQTSTNLLFVGPAGRSALSRLFLGSTSRYLLRHANCSVWIARKKMSSSVQDVSQG